MRIGMGLLGVRGFGDYQPPSGLGPVVLLDGSIIADPANTKATADQCNPFACGADPSNMATRYWCSYWDQVGSFFCTDPRCAPYRASIPGCTLPMVTPAPTFSNPTPAPLPPPPIPTLTNANITQPLPSITTSLRPLPPAEPDCSLWCVVNGAIDDHPVIALAVLLGIAAVMWPKKGRAF
jgi:hypothetical protein